MDFDRGRGRRERGRPNKSAKIAEEFSDLQSNALKCSHLAGDACISAALEKSNKPLPFGTMETDTERERQRERRRKIGRGRRIGLSTAQVNLDDVTISARCTYKTLCQS